MIFFCFVFLTKSLRVTGKKLTEDRILFVGAGQAACGIADLMALAISRAAGVSLEEAREKIFMCDVDGLLVEGRPEGQLDGPKNKVNFNV